MIKEKKELIMVMPDSNKNKWYRLVLLEDDSVISYYGRVGYEGQEKQYGRIGKWGFDKQIAAKLKKGYTELKVISDHVVISPQKKDLVELAKEQIGATNPAIANLIERLVKSNIHNILSSTSIKLSDDGLFKTPLGIVTLDAIEEARDTLAELKKNFIDKKDVNSNFSKYMRLIPHDFGMRMRVDAILNDKFFDDELGILDSLESSYNIAVAAPSKPGVPDLMVKEKVFDIQLNLADSETFSRLSDWFKRTNHATHGYSNVKISNIYSINGDKLENNFNRKLGAIEEALHGSNQANCLSILKSGIKASPPSSAVITGRLWGDGVYGAKDFSKSLQYTMGRFGGKYDKAGYIFVCDFAMGKIDEPRTYGGKRANGCDSIWARASKTGLRFDELIVPRSDQVKIKYLIEFA